MKIALIGPTDRSIWFFRRGLIKALVAQGHQVFVLCNAGDYVPNIVALGAVHIPTVVNRFLGPVDDLKYLWSLYRVFRQYKFDFIHTFTIKPNVLGAVAGRLAGIKRIYALVEGLGFGYPEEKGVRNFGLRTVFLLLYRIACALDDKVWFINQDDRNLFVSKHLLPASKAIFIRSVGVDLKEYSPERINSEDLARLLQEMGDPEHKNTYVIMVARMIWNKGVKEFVEAAELLLPDYPDARFLLVGEVQAGSPYSVSESFLRSNVPANVFWLNFRQDIPTLIALSDIVALPSYYREGVPRVLLEGMAMAKPIVTTDFPGCREVVKHGDNGYLVPIKNSRALAEAIGRLLANKELRDRMGAMGRRWVESELDERLVVQKVLKELYALELQGEN